MFGSPLLVANLSGQVDSAALLEVRRPCSGRAARVSTAIRRLCAATVQLPPPLCRLHSGLRPVLAATAGRHADMLSTRTQLAFDGYRLITGDEELRGKLQETTWSASVPRAHRP
jgi:hypothetical protein